MTYYKVKSDADGRGIYNYKGIAGLYLIGDELFTERELGKWCERGYKFPSSCFERVEISKANVYTSFGARFEITPT